MNTFLPDWESLLRPRRVALVGASERNDFADKFVKNNAQFGYQGELYFVNPGREQVFGRECYPSVAALPQPVDCAVISVPAPRIPAIIRESLATGIRSFVVHASGFAEANQEGAHLQAEIQRLCRSAGAGLIGPNCLGLINVKDRIALYGAPVPVGVPKGNVGVVAQSGSASIVLMNNARGIGFTYLASTGNEAVLTAEDLIDCYIDDPDTRVIALFLEGLRQPKRFMAVAQRAAAAGKPIIVLKVGLTDRGGAVSRGHTGAMAGSGRVHHAVFRQTGVVQVNDFDEMIEAVELFSRTERLPAGPRTAVIGISGGELAMVTDIAEAIGLPLPDLAPETGAQIRETLGLPEFMPAGNPVDVGAGYFSSLDYETKFYRCLTALGRDPNVDIVAVAQDAQQVLSEAQVPFYQQVTRAVARGAAELAKPVVFFSHLSAGFHAEITRAVRDAGLPMLQGTRESLTAIRHLGWWATRRREPPAEQMQSQPDAVRRALATLPAGQRLLGERAAKALLAEYGVPVTRERLATTADEAVAAALSIGFPVAMKVESPDIVHKSDVGGVRLGLNSTLSVETAFAEVMAGVRVRCPGALITGVLVTEQVEAGVELIVGIHQDLQFGPVLMVGLGGVLVEALNQSALAVPPLTREGARRLLAEFPGHQALEGFRGHPPADLESVADVLVRVGRLAVDGEGLFTELDINPLIVGPSGCRAVDARIILGE